MYNWGHYQVLIGASHQTNCNCFFTPIWPSQYFLYLHFVCPQSVLHLYSISDILKVDFFCAVKALVSEILRQKKCKNHTLNHIICVNHEEKEEKEVKMHKHLVCPYNSQYFAQTPENFARSHDRETVTFRNPAPSVLYCPPSDHHLFSICPPSVLHLSAICSQYVHHLSSICPPTVLPLSSICPPTVLPLSSICPPSVLHLSSISVLVRSAAIPLQSNPG